MSAQSAQSPGRSHAAIAFVATLVLSFASVACGGAASEPPPQTPSSTNGATATPASTAGATAGGSAALATQIAAGDKVYKDKCASCHGSSGEGDGDTPAAAGAKALPIAPPKGANMRKGEFKNAQDVETFVRKAMPIDAPGSLSDADAYAVVAWELKNSGTDLGGKALDATSATAVHVH